MAIRLGKVARNLNVGISTISEFLQKKGFALDDVSPNVKITQEQYEVLVKEFSSDKSLKIEADKFIKERHSNKEKQRAKAAEERVKEIETVLPEESRPKFKQVGKIDLDSIGKKHKVAPAKADKIETPVEVKKVEVVSDVSPKEKPVAKKKEEKTVKVKQLPTVEKTEEVDKKLSAPTVVKQPVKKNDVVVETTKNVIKENSVEKPKEKNTTVTKAKKDTVLRTEEKTAVKEKDKPTLTETNSAKVFKLHSDEPQSQIKVLGKIDLSSINQSTRPKKKTKEEKRKEREDKNKVRTDQKKLRDTSKTTTTASSAASEEAKKRKKRARINKEKVNVTANSNTHAHPRTHTGPNSSNNSSNTAGGQRKPYSNTTRPGQRSGGGYRKPLHPVHVKAEVSDEDVAKQVKETLARLTSKGKKTTARYRKEKRNSAHNRQQALDDKEMAQSKTLQLTEFVTANELASMMDVSVNEVIATCMSIGIIVSINQRLDAETINLVAEEFSYKTEYVSADVSESIEIEEDAAEDLVHRAPIVTVMGHVDHGKTSLLDYIRKENVIAGEAGGITQHIGAYNVRLSDGRRITFLDTPGHEAFTAMRARGAKVTDIAIIIVAADDDIKPQTKEAINHATAAGVPIIFAINKVDKPAANPEKIKEELAAMNFLVEDWGGKYQSQDISAKKGDGVRELLDKISLEAEMLELKANPNRRAMGSIIESTLDKGRGYVATVLVSNGTLKAGDIVLAGTNYGRIKAMFNERNKRIKAAGPSEPVLILGLNGAPTAGDSFHVIETEQEAREVATKREQLQREQGLRTQKLLTLDEVGRRIALGSFQELNIIVKGDVDGSIEALSDSLIKLSTEQIQVNVIHKAVGQISESDVTLAAASDAIIIGFQVRPSASARKFAEQEGVDVRMYSIIYDAIEEVKSAMEGMLAPKMKEEITSTIDVREVFNISKIGCVAGALVKEGKVKRSDKARLIRDGIVVFTGTVNALKRFKDDVKEVAVNYECGISLTNCSDIKVGDIIESFQEVEVRQTL